MSAALNNPIEVCTILEAMSQTVIHRH